MALLGRTWSELSQLHLQERLLEVLLQLELASWYGEKASQLVC
jgi:hypothetical protein